MEQLYLYGASGHGKVIAEIAQKLNIKIVGFIDDDPQKKAYFNLSVFQQIPELSGEDRLILSIGNNAIRYKIFSRHHDLHFSRLIHPNTSISNSAKIGAGTVIMAGVSINADSKIGQQVIINTNASIDHECTLSDFVHISPNAALAGDVAIGEGSHIGIGASIIQGIKIGKWCTIGAGAVIIRDVPDYATVVGNPGRIIKSTPPNNTD